MKRQQNVLKNLFACAEIKGFHQKARRMSRLIERKLGSFKYQETLAKNGEKKSSKIFVSDIFPL